MASVNNVAQPTSGTSGWDGDGTIGDPYRLQLDGSNDYVGVGPIGGGYKSLSVWFKVDSGYASTDYIFADGTNVNRAYVSGGNLYATYDGGTTYSTGIDTDTWYHYVVASDGATERHYLNGVEFASESDTAVTNTVNMALGSYYYTSASSTLDGAIADFRMYSDTLTLTEVEGIFAESAGRFYPTVSGTVYTDEGGTNIGANKTVRIAVNGTDFGTTAETDANGAYSVSGVTVSAGDVLTVYLEDEPEDAVAVTVSDGNDLGRPGSVSELPDRSPRQRRQPHQCEPGHGGRGRRGRHLEHLRRDRIGPYGS